MPAAVGAENVRTRILHAARPILESDSRASVAVLATAAGVSRATFHRVMGSRTDLVQALEMELDPGTRARILAAAIEMVGSTGLALLSMDQLATAAACSRASLYRIFPGKAALFRELVRVYSPLEAVARTVERMAGRLPAEVMPELARVVVAEMGGRVGMARTLVFEISSMKPDAVEGVDLALTRGIGAVMGYMVGQMAAGRLVAMNPVLALQGFVGPILLHLLTRDLVEARMGFDIPMAESATQLADAWVRAMTPAPGGS